MYLLFSNEANQLRKRCQAIEQQLQKEHSIRATDELVSKFFGIADSRKLLSSPLMMESLRENTSHKVLPTLQQWLFIITNCFIRTQLPLVSTGCGIFSVGRTRKGFSPIWDLVMLFWLTEQVC